MAHLPTPTTVAKIVKAATTDLSSIATFTPGRDSVWGIGGFIQITAATSGVMQMFVSYTDFNGGFTNKIIPSAQGQISSVGKYYFNSFSIPAKAGTAITIYTELAGAVLTYDVGGIIQGIKED